MNVARFVCPAVLWRDMLSVFCVPMFFYAALRHAVQRHQDKFKVPSYWFRVRGSQHKILPKGKRCKGGIQHLELALKFFAENLGLANDGFQCSQSNLFVIGNGHRNGGSFGLLLHNDVAAPLSNSLKPVL